MIGCYGIEKTKSDIIGKLELNSWYKFSKLKSGQYFIFIFVDKEGFIHRFDQNLNNF
jgi:hypothetical protein